MAPLASGPALAGLADLEAAVDDFVRATSSDLPTSEYLAARYDAGLARVDWPEGLGGRGLDRALQDRLERLLVAAGFPPVWPERNPIGLGMAAPILLTYGSPQQRRLLRGIWTAEELWCQLFSEPGAGSDLASLATRAVRDGDRWVVNGQKVWTSLAHQARWGLLVARTDPDLPKHRGLTYFVCDMHAEGVQVRPLRQLTGEAEFNEVFLNDVSVPDTDRLGAVGEGWLVARTTLANERLLSATHVPARGAGAVAGLLTAWRDGSRPPSLRNEVIDVWLQAESVRLLTLQMTQLQAAGGPGPEGSAVKLAHNALTQAASSLALDVAGGEALRYSDWSMRRTDYGNEPDRELAYHYLRTRANTIEGGTSEILRTVIAERVLGLPHEQRADVDIPWKDLPR